MPPKIKIADPSSLSEYQFGVLQAVVHHGGLTTRRLVRDHGPRVTWYPLLAQGYLKAVQTMYGEVIGLSQGSYLYYQERNMDSGERGDRRVDYLAGPTLLADRAFQNDALEILEREGYRVIARTYVNKQKKAVGNQRPEGHIVRYMLRVPSHAADLLAQDRRPVEAFNWSDHHRFTAQRGYPYLYASIGNGGIKAARLRALVQTYSDSPSSWRHPLIVALPQDHGLEDVLRQVAHKYSNAEWGTSGIWTGWAYIGKPVWVPRLRIIELPRA